LGLWVWFGQFLILDEAKTKRKLLPFSFSFFFFFFFLEVIFLVGFGHVADEE
jgi:hypothetical protein